MHRTCRPSRIAYIFAACLFALSCLVRADITYSDDISVDIRDHGAVGDGVNDDTAAMQTAINTAAQSGKKLRIPPASAFWKLNGTLLIQQPNLIIEGPGSGIQANQGTIRQTHPTAHAIVIRPPAGQPSTHYIQFRDLCILGPGASTIGGNGIVIDTTATTFVDEVSFENVQVYGFNVGFSAYHWSNSFMRGCIFYRNMVGVKFGGNCNAIHFDTSWFGYNFLRQIHINGSGSPIVFTACEGGNGPNMLKVEAGNHVIFEGMNIEGGGDPYTDNECWVEVENGGYLEMRNVRFIAHQNTQGAFTAPILMRPYATGKFVGCGMAQFHPSLTTFIRATRQNAPNLYVENPPGVIGGAFYTTDVYSDGNYSGTPQRFAEITSDWTLGQHLPPATADRRGQEFEVFSDFIGIPDVKYKYMRLADGSTGTVSLTPTLTANLWQYTQQFAPGAGLTFGPSQGNIETGNLRGGLKYTADPAKAGRDWMLSGDTYGLGNLALLTSPASGGGPSRPRYFHDSIRNRTTIGFDQTSAPTGTATLNVAGTLGVADRAFLHGGATIQGLLFSEAILAQEIWLDGHNLAELSSHVGPTLQRLDHLETHLAPMAEFTALQTQLDHRITQLQRTIEDLRNGIGITTTALTGPAPDQNTPPATARTLLLAATTDSDAPVELLPVNDQPLTIPAGRTWLITAKITARHISGDSRAFTRQIAIKNTGGAASLVRGSQGKTLMDISDSTATSRWRMNVSTNGDRIHFHAHTPRRSTTGQVRWSTQLEILDTGF